MSFAGWAESLRVVRRVSVATSPLEYLPPSRRWKEIIQNLPLLSYVDLMVDSLSREGNEYLMIHAAVLKMVADLTSGHA